MVDVVQIAKDRRKALAAELAKLDEFIKMAETLLNSHESQRNRAFDSASAKTTGSVDAMMPRRAAVAGATASAT